MPEEKLDSIQNLSELEDIVKTCLHCPLCKSRTNVVFGMGNPSADIMFVGEAPGYHEDRQGLPFVGAAGRLLDELLISVLGLTRKEVYIANVLKCRPPGNRDPLPEEVEHCRPFLVKQIQLIDPRVICSLGNHATRALLRKNISISKIHGNPIRAGKRTIFPTYHPAAALYAGSTRELLSTDFKHLGELANEAGNSKTTVDDSRQMDLF